MVGRGAWQNGRGGVREIPVLAVGRSQGRGWPGLARERRGRRPRRLRGVARGLVQGLVRRLVGGIWQIRCRAGRVRYDSRRHGRLTLRKPRRLGQDTLRLRAGKFRRGFARLRAGKFRQGIASRKSGRTWMPVVFRPGATVRRPCCSSPCPLRVAPCGRGGMIRRGGSRSRRRGSCGGPGRRLGWWPCCGSGGGSPISRGSTRGNGWGISRVRWRWSRVVRGCSWAVRWCSSTT